MSTTPTLRPSSRVLALTLLGASACVAVPDPDLTVARGADAGGGGGEPGPSGGQDSTGGHAATGGSAEADLDLPSERPRDLGVGGALAPDAGFPGEPRLAEQNPLGAAARVVEQEMPANADEADALGCRVASRERGSILYGAFHFAGRSLTSYVTPDEEGNVEMVLLARTPDWHAGQRVRDLDQAGLTLEEGGRGGSTDEFVLVGAGTSGTFTPFAVADDGTFETGEAFVSVKLPLVYGGQTIFTMEHATLRGRLVVDGPGFGLKQGFLEGYYTRSGVAESIRYMDAICSGEHPEDWCRDFRLIVPPGGCRPFGDQGTCDLLIDALALFVGGFDARVDPGEGPAACSGADCNAVGVCLAVSMAGVSLSGSP